jgi:transposase
VASLVFLDEAGINLGMSRSHARAPIGERAFAKRTAKGGNISLVGAVRTTGMCGLYPYDGPIDGFRFLDFLGNQLLPNLQPGDVVVMDNLRVHHIEAVATLLSSVGARPLFLPPYSPERNPIEEIWSLIKNLFKSAEARTISAMVETMKQAKEAVTIDKIKGYFSHAGYF